jgi:hypothetical protein
VITDILDRLDSHNEYSETSDSRQLRKDAAEHIRHLNAELWAARREIDSLRNAMHAESRKRELTA